MKRILTNTALTLALALGVAVPATMAKARKPKASAEHTAAVKKCSEDYSAALKDAKTKKGKEASAARTAARTAKTECMKNAPR